MVRPRPPLLNIDRERASLLGLEIVERSVLVETADRDSDVDRSIQTAGTEEHSSFSEQAWDFYQVCSISDIYIIKSNYFGVVSRHLPLDKFFISLLQR